LASLLKVESPFSLLALPRASPRKDNYRDLKMQKGEFKEDTVFGYLSRFMSRSISCLTREFSRRNCETLKLSPIHLPVDVYILNPPIDVEILKMCPSQDVQRGIQTGRIGGEGKRSVALIFCARNICQI